MSDDMQSQFPSLEERKGEQQPAQPRRTTFFGSLFRARGQSIFGGATEAKKPSTTIIEQLAKK